METVAGNLIFAALLLIGIGLILSTDRRPGY